MRRRTVATVLALGALVVASGGEPARTELVPAGHVERPATRLVSPVGDALVRPLPPLPTIITTAHAPATRGWSRTTHASRALPGPASALAKAYAFAVAAAPEHCHLDVSLLAAIGQVESGNAAGRTVDAGNRVVPEIIGPALDGHGYAAIPDTDGGALDHDPRWDHAVGPFQFIPSSWRVAGVDFDGDGVRDPQDVYDAAGAAMVYLCAGDRDLQDPAQLEAAVLAYNHSRAYLRLVLHWQAVYATGSGWAAGSGVVLVAAGVPATRPRHATHQAVHQASHQATGSVPVHPATSHASPQSPATSSASTATPAASTPAHPAPVVTCPTASATPSDAPSTDPSADPTATPAPSASAVPDPTVTPAPTSVPSDCATAPAPAPGG